MGVHRGGYGEVVIGRRLVSSRREKGIYLRRRSQEHGLRVGPYVVQFEEVSSKYNRVRPLLCWSVKEKRYGIA